MSTLKLVSKKICPRKIYIHTFDKENMAKNGSILRLPKRRNKQSDSNDNTNNNKKHIYFNKCLNKKMGSTKSDLNNNYNSKKASKETTTSAEAAAAVATTTAAAIVVEAENSHERNNNEPITANNDATDAKLISSNNICLNDLNNNSVETIDRNNTNKEEMEADRNMSNGANKEAETTLSEKIPPTRSSHFSEDVNNFIYIDYDTINSELSDIEKDNASIGRLAMMNGDVKSLKSESSVVLENRIKEPKKKLSLRSKMFFGGNRASGKKKNNEEATKNSAENIILCRV